MFEKNRVFIDEEIHLINALKFGKQFYEEFELAGVHKYIFFFKLPL